ncbi:MAG: addiction module toxin, HicA family [Thermodesulfobacteriota bacterium]|nr:addiction module toxin, HicA family [Thermodesulfobacteriota bacterium]
MDSRTVIKKLKQDGWSKVDQEGRVTVPHPRKDFPIDTLGDLCMRTP